MRFGFRELIFLVVLLAVPVVSYFYVFKPRNADIARIEQENSVKLTKLEKVEARTEGIDDMELEIAETLEMIDRVKKKMPDEEGVDTVLNDVWEMARDNRLAVRSVKSDKPVPAALYMELPLKMVMEGQFFGFYEFLSQLERMPRITRIHDLHLERIDQKRNPNAGELPAGAMRAEFTLSIYYEPEKKSGESIETPEAAAG